MEETKICAACEIEQPMIEFWGDNSLNDGKSRRCKTCIKNKNLIPIERRLSRFTEKDRKVLLKQECDIVYQFLQAIGYDLTKDLHQQFLDRHNQNNKIQMKYKKKRKSEMPAFFPDGTYNEEYKYRHKLLDD